MREEDLYPPLKAFLEGQGYAVKGEVRNCDLVACREGEAGAAQEEPVIVEMKLRLTLALVLQGVARLSLSERVYLAVPRTTNGKSTLGKKRREILGLCRRLGLGLLTVDLDRVGGDPALAVEAVLDPAPYAPRQSTRKRGMLLKEFAHRVGDPNTGGSSTGRKRMTAYRQDALRIAHHLSANGSSRPKDIKSATGVARAAAMLQRDVYGWFMRVDRGIYTLSPKGTAALNDYAETVARLTRPAEAAE
ncbi:MAG: DUF2161 domain-containing phosphodiesterase [Alphaproteobacteria bacterium]